MKIDRVMQQIAVAGSLALLALPLAATQPVGDLEVRGTATVESADSGESTRLNDTSYAWFSGDRLVTEESTGVLNLAAGGSLGIDKQSDVTIRVDGGSVDAELEAGSLMYALDTSSALQVNVGDYRFVTNTGEARPMEVSNDDVQVAGIIHRTPEGEINVSVHGGELTMTQGAGQRYVVSSGEEATINGGAVEILSVQLDDDMQGNGGGWIQENPGMFALAVVGTAAAGYVIYDQWIDDDDDDDEPASP